MGRYRRKREAKARRRPWEFSKKLAAWAVLVATAAAVASYVLAFRDQQTASDVTTTIFTACIGYLVSYAAKSATEKISRNRHGLDADGNPIGGAGTGENTKTTTTNKTANIKAATADRGTFTSAVQTTKWNTESTYRTGRGTFPCPFKHV